MSLTDEDYINFMVRMREVHETSPVPRRIQQRLAFSVIALLFIGYSLKDYNLRILLKMLRAGKDVGQVFPPLIRWIGSPPDPACMDLLVRARYIPKFVNFIARDIWTFVPELYKEVFNEEMPA